MNDSKNVAVVRRSPVAPKSNYHDYKENLRFDFWYSCAYCSTTELEGGGVDFQIDHYYPQSCKPELKNDYDNLMWACRVCNRYKGEFYPSDLDEELGNIILRPDKHDPREHLELQNYRVKGKTPTGKFNELYLYLNRKGLIRLRQLRERFWNAIEYIAFGITELANLGLDEITPEKRFGLTKIRNIVNERDERRQEKLQDVVREFARSPLLDLDEGKETHLRRRRDFLKSQRAITVEAGRRKSHSKS